jgi:hypothetical protein
MTQPIKLESLRELVHAGSVRVATILGQKGGYAVVANIGLQQRALGNKAGEVRMFSTTDTAVKVLRELGVQQFHVDVSQYEPGSLRPGRPDAARKMKQAAEVLAHDRWFRQEVQNTLDAIERGDEELLDSDAMWGELAGEAKQMDAAKRAGRA